MSDPSGFTVTRTTKLGRATIHAVADLANNVEQRTLTGPDGVTHESTEATDAGTTHVTSSEGTTSDSVIGPDPRFGMQAALPTSIEVHFPSGLTTEVTRTRNAVLTNPDEPAQSRHLDRDDHGIRPHQHVYLHSAQPDERVHEPARAEHHDRGG